MQIRVLFLSTVAFAGAKMKQGLWLSCSDLRGLPSLYVTALENTFLGGIRFRKVLEMAYASEIEKYQSTISRALGWLKRNHEEAMKAEDFSAHYKAPFLYAVLGEPVLAREYLDLIENKYLQDDGDFRTSASEKGWPHLPCSPANRYIYPNGWTILAFQRLGAYNIARKGLDFIRKFQSPDLGGFYSRYDPKTGVIGKDYIDSSSTSSAGLALLGCGHIEEALAAGEFLLRFIDAQPDLDKYYYSTWQVGKGLMTDVFGDEDPISATGRKQFCVSTEENSKKELIWLPGVPLTFLCKLYEYTQDERFLRGSERLFGFFDKIDEGKWVNPTACKIMWGGAELYRMTGNEKVGQAVKKIMDYFSDAQHETGFWLNSTLYKTPEEQPFPSKLDGVQEFTGEISDSLFNLAGGKIFE